MRAKAKTTGGARMGERRGAGRHQVDLRPDTRDDDLGEAKPGRCVEACVAPLALEP